MPHAPTLNGDVYASAWPLGEETVWTLVNRNAAIDVSGPVLQVAAEDSRVFYDCVQGNETYCGR